MKNFLINDIIVTDIADEGRAVGRVPASQLNINGTLAVNDKIIFLDKAVPGDVVDVRVTKNKKSYLEGKVLSIKSSSSLRTEPFCEHFGICGGCKWQHLDYNAQLSFKQKQVSEALKRIGRVNDFEMLPIIGSENTTHYRNKLEFTFSNKRWLTHEELINNNGFDEPALGFHIPSFFDKVLDINTCHLQPDPSNEIRKAVKDYTVKNNYSFFDLKKQNGLLRNLIIRNTTLNEWMVILVFHNDGDEKQRTDLMNYLKQSFQQITSLMYLINPKRNDTIYDLNVHLFSGNPYITEQMENLQFRIGPKSFFQTNSLQALKLYQTTREFASLTGNEIVYDLYTGTGTIANFVAAKAKKVIGIEYIAEAIEDAKTNSELNNVSNTSFHAGDIKNILNESFVAENGTPDVIITDPPRAGMHEDVTNSILNSGAKRIVYVSCNAATQARDINLLSGKYQLIKSQPVDMFPHTHHVENIALLILK